MKFDPADSGVETENSWGAVKFKGSGVGGQGYAKKSLDDKQSVGSRK